MDAAKAKWNRQRAKRWLFAVIVLQIVGGVLAVIKATGPLDVDLFGIASAAAASIIGWIQLKDHVQLDEAYSLASHDLSLAEQGVSAVATEGEWADSVAAAAQAISREHRMWRAARGTAR